MNVGAKKGTEASDRLLEWHSGDIEQKLGFAGGKYTDSAGLLALISGILFTLVVYGVILLAGDNLRESKVSQLLADRGPTPYAMVFLSAWCSCIFLVKLRKLAFQRRALGLEVMPHSSDYVLTSDIARPTLDRLYSLVDDPKRFVLFNRIERALLNLRNIGNISDVSEMLRSQAENDEDHMESSYALPKGFVWAIPILGFVGTVMGLSDAIGGFGAVLSSGDGMDALKSSLTEVTAGLAVAFDTTLVALLFALTLQLVLVTIKKKEENFLDECRDYCHKNVISKLRLESVAVTASGGSQ